MVLDLLNQARKENAHLVTTATACARKMGFPDVIMPGNLLYYLNFIDIC